MASVCCAKRMEFLCWPSASAAERRRDVVEEEKVARKRHMDKQCQI